MGRRLIGSVAVALVALVVLVVAVPVSRAAFVRTTVSAANSAATLTVAPPTNVASSLSLNVTPLLTCRANISWTASTTPGVTSYELIRITASSGVVVAGPFTVTATSYVDTPLSFQVVGSAYGWRVRAVLSTWRSAYVTASGSYLAACLL